MGRGKKEEREEKKKEDRQKKQQKEESESEEEEVETGSYEEESEGYEGPQKVETVVFDGLPAFCTRDDGKPTPLVVAINHIVYLHKKQAATNKDDEYEYEMMLSSGKSIGISSKHDIGKLRLFLFDYARYVENYGAEEEPMLQPEGANK